MEYTAVIRTLGTAGEKYQQLLNSLIWQTIPPKKIIVYIAKGYPIPKETVGCEEYIYVKKGMVAQRALQYNEVTTEYILFLDDDLVLPPNFMERMYGYYIKEGVDIISPDVFQNFHLPFLGKLMMLISGRMKARYNDKKWGYKVMRNAGFSYNNNPINDVYLSQTNAGACFFCKKDIFLSIHLEDELWLDNMPYALGDDQVMFYKMHLQGLKVVTLFHTNIVHQDASGNATNPEKEKNLIYCDFRFKTIFWHRFIYLPEKSSLKRIWSILCIGYVLLFTLFISLLKGQFDIFRLKWNAIMKAVVFIKSDEYKDIPHIRKLI